MELPTNVNVLPPLSRMYAGPIRRHEVLSLLGPRFHRHLRGLAIERCQPSIENAKKWLISSVGVERALRTAFFRDQLLPAMKEAVLYFFWGTDYARILPFLPMSVARSSAVRFHGFDLYHQRASGFLPHQKAIIEHAGSVLAVSAHGAAYLRTCYPRHAGKIRVAALGTEVRGQCKRSDDGVLRVVSCGFVRSEKRTNLIAEALRSTTRRVEWTHIGDGPLFDELKAATALLPTNVSARLLGRMSNEAILQLYERLPIDVFVNVSATEGLPVSIMEAMCAGIPVIATDVGGSSELVDASTGMLLPANFAATDLTAALETFADLRPDEIELLRKNCRAKIRRDHDRDLNANRLAQILLELSKTRA